MEKISLKNGLTVYLDPRKYGLCASYIYINAGQWHNIVPETAHTLEHLKATAAKVYGERKGLNYASANAETTLKRTTYYFRDLLPENLPEAVRNLSLIFTSPDIHILQREKEAVRHELAPYVNPLIEFQEEGSFLLFPNYRKRVSRMAQRIKSLDEINFETVQTFSDQHYDPNNSFMYICGDINYDPELLFEPLREIPTKGNKSQKVEFEDEVKLKERVERTARVRLNKIAGVDIVYQSPAFPFTLSHKEDVAFWIFVNYLSSDFGLLHKRMRDENNLCYSFDVDFQREIGKLNCFGFSTTTQPDLVYKVEQEWLKAIAQLGKENIRKEELASLVNRQKVKMIKRQRRYDHEEDFLLKLDLGVDANDAMKVLDELTPEDLRKTAQIFSERSYMISISLPKD